MKRLATLRHAKSSWADPGMADFDRPLNDRGREAARDLGREMTRRRMRFDLVLASPAQRVRETLDGVGQDFGLEREVRFEPPIYDASVATLFELIYALPENCESALLAGHNPGLHELVLDLTDPDDAGLRDRIRGKYPTAALAVVELAPERWAEVRPGSGRIVELVLPRDLAD
ncbi:MAG TPA: histidine phosphatase family protein [Sphingomicrobium sp.]